MDFIVDLPPVALRDGRVVNAILVVIDRFSKIALYCPTTKTATAADLAEIFIEKVVSRFGVPKLVVSDRGSVFLSKL
jgi:hypothetical protein